MKVRSYSSNKNLDLSSLLDVLFLVLIFLMVSFRLPEETRIQSIQLPESKYTEGPSSEKQMVVRVLKDGHILWSGKSWDLLEWEGIFPEAKEETNVVLEMDSELPFGLFVKISDFLKGKGYLALKIAVTEKK